MKICIVFVVILLVDYIEFFFNFYSVIILCNWDVFDYDFIKVVFVICRVLCVMWFFREIGGGFLLELL